MKFVCDVNIAIRVTKFLATRGTEATHVNQLENKWNTPDKIIRELADASGLIVVSKDADFRDSFLLRRTPKKLIHVCVGNAATDDIIELLNQNWEVIVQYAASESFYLELNYNGIIPIVA